MDNMDFNIPDDVKVSKYNSGISQLMRMDAIWKDAHSHSRKGELTKWNWDLDRIWVELAGDIKETDNLMGDYQAFTVSVGDLNKLFIDKKIDAKEYSRRMYQLLLDKEVFLRRLQNKLGKGTKFVDPDEDDFD